MKTQAARLQYVLSEINKTPYEFSKELGYKRPDSIYHVLNQQQKISTSMQERIMKTNYEINEVWLISGKGSPFIKKVLKGSYGSEYFSNGMAIYPARLKFQDIKLLAKNFAQQIFTEELNISYEVKVRASNIEGLEFIYTTFSIENNEKYLDRNYSLLISPEWKVCQYFDFWRITQRSRRCENLLNISNDFRKTYLQCFENKIRSLLDTFDESYFDDEDSDNNLTQMNKDKEGFVQIYSTDLR